MEKPIFKMIQKSIIDTLNTYELALYIRLISMWNAKRWKDIELRNSDVKDMNAKTFIKTLKSLQEKNIISFPPKSAKHNSPYIVKYILKEVPDISIEVPDISIEVPDISIEVPDTQFGQLDVTPVISGEPLKRFKKGFKKDIKKETLDTFNQLGKSKSSVASQSSKEFSLEDIIEAESIVYETNASGHEHIEHTSQDINFDTSSASATIKKNKDITCYKVKWYYKKIDNGIVQHNDIKIHNVLLSINLFKNLTYDNVEHVKQCYLDENRPIALQNKIMIDRIQIEFTDKHKNKIFR